MSWTRSRFTFSIRRSLHATGDARHVLLPLRPEGQDEEVAPEGGVLSQGEQLAATLVGDLAEAVGQLLVERWQGRDLLQLLAVEPAVHHALVLLVQPEAHVDGADDATLGVPLAHQLADGWHVLLVGRGAADDDDHLLRVGPPLHLSHRGLEAGPP